MIKITREELHQKVWATPMRRLAKEFGVSDVALAKTCRRLEVPRPGRGYWARLEAGQRLRRPVLPRAKPGTPTSATINPNSIQKMRVVPSKEDVAKVTVQIPRDFRGCSPPVAKTRDALMAATYHHQGVFRSHGSGTLDVRVGKVAIRRALLICQGFLDACQERGWKVSPSEQAQTKIEVAGEALRITVREKVTITKLKHSTSVSWHRYEYVPSGILTLEVHGGSYKSGLKRAWLDSKKFRLEDLLPEILVTLQLHFEALREERLQQEEEERRRDEVQRQREAYAKRIELERSKRANLVRLASAWNRANEIRDLCDELRTRVAEGNGDHKVSDVERWLTWAEEITKRIDPFENGQLESAISETKLDASLECASDF